jgi:hypothetical protein
VVSSSYDGSSSINLVSSLSCSSSYGRMHDIGGAVTVLDIQIHWQSFSSCSKGDILVVVGLLVGLKTALSEWRRMFSCVSRSS